MSYAVLNNGRKIPLTNDQALKIYKVLNNQAEPANEQQAAFCLTVADVGLAGTVDEAKDQVLEQIMHDDSLYGFKKAQAVAKRLKERQVK
jgi:hypothetical protein